MKISVRDRGKVTVMGLYYNRKETSGIVKSFLYRIKIGINVINSCYV